MARVLLVESDSAMRENLREIFARLRPEFVLAGEALDGESALQMLADLSPDILIIERQLPFMDGVALWQKARRMQPWVQGIVIGGRDDPESVRSAGAMGIEEYLLRPVTAYGMRDALERAEGRIRMTAGMMREKIAAARCVVMPQRREAEMRFGLWLRDGVGHACEVRQRGRYCRLLRVEGGGGLAADIARLIEYDCGDGVVAMELEREVATGRHRRRSGESGGMGVQSGAHAAQCDDAFWRRAGADRRGRVRRRRGGAAGVVF